MPTDETDPRRFGYSRDRRGSAGQADSGVRFLVGAPKGRLTRYEAALAERPWQAVRPHLRVKLLPQDGELYVLAESAARASPASRPNTLFVFLRSCLRHGHLSRGAPRGTRLVLRHGGCRWFRSSCFF
ncbi:MAG: hypothetical protein HY302_02045 [Opitutae bacterium]|nr:hypothetical protein [Opitutae bacterium]